MRPLPDWLEPMPATLSHEPVTGGGWRFERKHDGVRLLAYRSGDVVRLLSRNRIEQDLPAVAAALVAMPGQQLILDGEVTWGAPHTYHVFDVLWRDGESCTQLPLAERVAQLDRLWLASPLEKVGALTAADPWGYACDAGWEGVVAKRLDSTYEHRRSPHWVKLKCEQSQVLVVGGFTEPRGSRVGLGALLVGHFDGPDFVFAGKVGTGFDAATLAALRARLDPISQADSPFTRATSLPRAGAHWVRPEVVVQIAFLQWTGNGKLRHPRFVGLRADRAAREIVREG